MPKVYKNGVELHVSRDELQTYLQQGWDVSPGQTVQMRDEFGDKVDLAATDRSASIARTADVQGYTPRGEAEVEHEVRVAELRKKYGDGWANDARSFAEGVGRGLTFGGSDYLMDALGADMEGIRMRRALNPDASLVGEIGGAVLPAIATLGIGAPESAAGVSASLARSAVGKGLMATPAGLAMRLGGKIGAGLGVGGSSIARATFARAAGAAAEGAVFGAGTAVSDAILHEKPLLSEAVFANIGSNAMYGGAFGAAIGGGMEFLGRVGRGAANKLKAFKKNDFQHVAGVLDDKGDDFAGVHRAISDELDSVTQHSAAAREALEAESAVLQTRASTRALTEAETAQAGNLRSMIAELDDTSRAMRAAVAGTGTKERLVRSAGAGLDLLPATPPASVLSANRLSEIMKAGEMPTAALESMGAHYDAVGRAMDMVNPGTGSTLNKSLAQLGDAGAAGSPGVMRLNAMDFAAAADLAGFDADQLPVVGPAADKILKLWTGFRVLDLASGGKAGGAVAGKFRKGSMLNTGRDAMRRSAVINASRRYNTFGSNKFTQTTAAGLVGAGTGMIFDKVVPRAASAAAVTLPGRIGSAAGASVRKLGRAVDKMMGLGKPVARGAAGWGTMAAFKNVSYAELDPKEIPKTKGVNKNYLRVAAELRYAVNNMGRTRESIKQQLSGLAMIDPGLATQLELLRLKQITFLEDRAPKAPAVGMFGRNMHKYGPSDSQVAQFARFVRAVENPQSVIDDAANWRLTPEAAEAMREVYPELFNKIRNQVVDYVATSKGEVPYEKRLQLGVLFDAPLDSFLTAENIRFLQSTFMAPEAGMQSPPPQGTLSAAEPTAAGKLQG